jgi:hypothetical protein
MGKDITEAMVSVVLALNSLLGCFETVTGESVVGEEINPFLTRELRRLESGAALSTSCVDETIDGDGGRPGGKGGRELFGPCACKGAFSIAELRRDEEATIEGKVFGSGPAGTRGRACKLARSPPLFGLNPLFKRPVNKLLVLVRSELIGVESMGNA